MRRRTLFVTLGALTSFPARALYDPKPLALIEAARGTWGGNLTYRDYQKPDRMVTLKTELVASLVAPDELALFYVFDDGPGKTVYSYERLKFDLVANLLVWTSGINKPDRAEYQITTSVMREGRYHLTFQRTHDASTDDYLFEVNRQTWLLAKHESTGNSQRTLRSKYEFTRREG